MGNSTNKRINDFTIFVTAFVYLTAILFGKTVLFNLSITCLATLNILISRKVQLKYFFYTFIILVIPLISVFITTLIYYNGLESNPSVFFIGKFGFSKPALETALYLVSRTFSLTFISMSYVFAIRFDVMIFSMLQNFKLPVSIGYSLLSAVQAIAHLKDDYFRIRTAYKMRFGRNKSPLLLLIPLLVGASRYAYFAGLSLQSRGLNNNKTYLERNYFSFSDIFYVVMNIGFILFVVLFFKVPN